jgi:outer membrane protein OmpA-like peptidoglycan-associated protein
MRSVKGRRRENQGGAKMRSVKRTLLTALLGTALVIALCPAGALALDGYNHSNPQLRMGIGARGLAMGGAYTAVTDDLTALYWNPAGLAHVGKLQFTAFYSGGLEADRDLNYFGFAHHWYGEDEADYGTFSIGWLNSGMDGFREFDLSGTPLGTFDFNRNNFYLGWGRAFTENDRLGLGFGLKFLHDKVTDSYLSDADANNMGGGFDVGMYFNITEQAKFGFAWQDIYTRIGAHDAEEDTDVVPWNLRFGLALMPMDPLIVAIDVEKAEQDDMLLNFGGEYGFVLAEDYDLALRMGFNDGDFAAGFGLGLKWFQFDYAYVNDPSQARAVNDFLDSSHRLSLSVVMPGPADVDTDADGIMDKHDECPREAEDYDGYEDGDGCPDADNDGDGILDIDDDCPLQAEDMDGWEDEDGCPDPDNDGDGILDVDDRCANNAETFNNFEDDDGCPDDARPDIPVFINIIFQFGTDRIVGSDHVPVLDYMAEVLRNNPEMRMLITGHTDNVGSDAANMILSEKRARAVMMEFVQLGIDETRFDLDWKGESEPIDTNDTEEGRQRNRRIEFTVLE